MRRRRKRSRESFSNWSHIVLEDSQKSDNSLAGQPC